MNPASPLPARQKLKLESRQRRVMKGLRARQIGNPSRKFRQESRNRSVKKTMPVTHPKKETISRFLATKLRRKSMSKVLALRSGQGS